MTDLTWILRDVNPIVGRAFQQILHSNLWAPFRLNDEYIEADNILLQIYWLWYMSVKSSKNNHQYRKAKHVWGAFPLAVSWRMRHRRQQCFYSIVSKHLYWFLPFSGKKIVFMLFNYVICLLFCFVSVLVTYGLNIECFGSVTLFAKLLIGTV